MFFVWISWSHSNEMSIDNFKIPKIIRPKKTHNLAQKIQSRNLNQRRENSQEKSEKKEKCWGKQRRYRNPKESALTSTILQSTKAPAMLTAVGDAHYQWRWLLVVVVRAVDSGQQQRWWSPLSVSWSNSSSSQWVEVWVKCVCVIIWFLFFLFN